MKQELFKVGKTIAFKAGKYMPKALTGLSAGATVGGIFLAVQAGMEFQKLKDEGKEITWKDYGRIFGPCVAAGVFAIACAFAGLTESEKRYAAAAALASMYESKEKEIDAKVREMFGDNEAEKMHDEIAKDRINNAPEPVIYDGQAFLDILTGQYIYMGTEDIKARINRLNERMNDGYSISKDEYCDIFNLYSCSADTEIGWNTKLTGNIKARFTYHKLASGRDVAALDVNEPKLFYYEDDYDDKDDESYLNQYNPGWSEV